MARLCESTRNKQTRDIWKTIDDVNATFDSLSLINRDQSINIREKNKENIQNEFIDSTVVQDRDVLCKEFADLQQPHPVEELSVITKETNDIAADANENKISINNIITVADSKRWNNYGMGRGRFLKELQKIRFPADKDATLKEELNDVFPCNFSNELIEKHWVPLESAAEGDRFKDYETEDIVESNYLNGQNLFANIEARLCSPPSLEPSSNSGSPHHYTIVFDILNSTAESITSEEEDDICSTTAIEAVPSTSSSSSLLPPAITPTPIHHQKRCRNALLVGLNRKESSRMKQLKNNIVLKTPNDFLKSYSDNRELNSSFVLHHSSLDNGCIDFENPFKKDINNFHYSEDDFPTL